MQKERFKMSQFTGGQTTDQNRTTLLVNGSIVDVEGAGLSGTAVISSGGTSVTVSLQSIGVTPHVFLEPLSNLGGRSVWISGKSQTGFTINVSSSGGSSFTFGWRVFP
jgi:hypothetical protein